MLQCTHTASHVLTRWLSSLLILEASIGCIYERPKRSHFEILHTRHTVRLEMRKYSNHPNVAPSTMARSHASCAHEATAYQRYESECRPMLSSFCLLSHRIGRNMDPTGDGCVTQNAGHMPCNSDLRRYA